MPASPYPSTEVPLAVREGGEELVVDWEGGVRLLELADGAVDPARVAIREWEAGDVPTVAVLANDADVSAELRDRFPYPYPRSAAADMYKYVSAIRAEAEAAGAAGGVVPVRPMLRAITVDGVFVGGIGVYPGTAEARCVGEIGYWLGKRYWGHGIAPLVVAAMTDIAFATFPDIVRLEATIQGTNLASQRVVAKVGYVLEAIHHNATIKRGVYKNVHIMVRWREGYAPGEAGGAATVSLAAAAAAIASARPRTVAP